jgi:hypothetical protein
MRLLVMMLPEQCSRWFATTSFFPEATLLLRPALSGSMPD